MKYRVVFPNGGVFFATNHGTIVVFDRALALIKRCGWETAAESIRRVYPEAAIFPESRVWE
jgi:hypothetical protein